MRSACSFGMKNQKNMEVHHWLRQRFFFGLDAKAKERSANRIEKLIVFDDFANEEYIYIF